MSIFDWERDIEFIDYDKEREALEMDHPFSELPFHQFVARDMIVRYQTSKQRIVTIKPRNEDEDLPLISAFIRQKGGKEHIRRGLLVGSQDIVSRVVTPHILIANQMPVIKEFGHNGGELQLPLPLFGFDVVPVQPVEK